MSFHCILEIFLPIAQRPRRLELMQKKHQKSLGRMPRWNKISMYHIGTQTEPHQPEWHRIEQHLTIWHRDWTTSGLNVIMGWTTSRTEQHQAETTSGTKKHQWKIYYMNLYRAAMPLIHHATYGQGPPPLLCTESGTWLVYRAAMGMIGSAGGGGWGLPPAPPLPNLGAESH